MNPNEQAQRQEFWEARITQAYYAVVVGNTPVHYSVWEGLSRLPVRVDAKPDEMVEMIVAAGSAVPTRRDAVQVLIPEAAGVEACWVAKGQAFRYVLPGTYALATYLVARVDPIQEMFDNAERLRKKGQWAEAAAAYAEVLQRDRRHWQSLRGYAFVLRELDRRGEAMCYVNESVRVNPRYSRGWRTKGALHRDAGNHAEGLACYERAIALDPEDPVARQNRINALGALGRKVEAEAARRELARMRDEK